MSTNDHVSLCVQLFMACFLDVTVTQSSKRFPKFNMPYEDKLIWHKCHPYNNNPQGTQQHAFRVISCNNMQA